MPAVDEDTRGEQLVHDANPKPFDGSPESSISRQITPGELAAQDQRDAAMREANGGDLNSTRPASANVASAATKLLPAGKIAGVANAVVGFASQNKKGIGVGGGITGIILLIITIIISLMPLKLDSIMKNIEQQAFGRIEQYAERRAERIMAKYFLEKLGGKQEGFYMGRGLLSTLKGNLDASKYMSKLEKKGIKVSSTGDGGIKFESIDGKFSSGSLKNPEEVMAFLDKGDLYGRQATAAMKATTKETTHFWQIMKRYNLRKYIRGVLGVQRWGIPKQNSDEHAKAAETSETGNPTTDATADIAKDAGPKASAESLSCALGADCSGEDKRARPSGEKEGVPGANIDSSKESEESGKLRQVIGDQWKELKTTAGEAAKSAATKQLSKRIGEKGAAAITKFTAEASNPIGWIMLAGPLDKFLWDGSLTTAATNVRKAEYMAVYADFLTLDSQKRAGELGAEQVNDVMLRIQDIEKSEGLSAFYGTTPSEDGYLQRGEMVGTSTTASIENNKSTWPSCNIGFMQDPNEIVSSGRDTAGAAGTFADNLNQRTMAEVNSGVYDTYTLWYRFVMGAHPAAPIGLHTGICMVNGAVEWVIGAGMSIISWFSNLPVVGGLYRTFLAGIFAPINLSPKVLTDKTVMEWLDWGTEHIVEIFDTFVRNVFSPIGAEVASNVSLGNYLRAGGESTANAYCRDALGCHEISTVEAYEQTEAANKAKLAEINSRGLISSLTSIESPYTFSSRFLASIPSTPQQAASNIGSSTLAFIGNPMKYMTSLAATLVPRSYAAASVGFAGVQPFGLTEDDLNSDLQNAESDIAGPPGPDGKLTGPDGKIDEFDCPYEPDPTKVNMCLLDSSLTYDMVGSLNNEDSFNIGGGDVATSTGGGGSSNDPPNSEGWVWPIKKSQFTNITQCWDSTKTGYGHHAGIDLGVNTIPAYAAHDGTVHRRVYGNIYAGNYLIIKVKDQPSLYYVYEHMSSISVSEGQDVTAGQQIGVTGATGRGTGPHLHFGISTDGSTGAYSSDSQVNHNTLNPLNYLPDDRDRSCT